MMRKSIYADFSLLFVAFIWGSTFVLVQKAISFLEPFSFNSVRFFIAAVLLGSWLIFFERKQLRNIQWHMILSGLLLGVWLFIGYAFQTLGLLYTTSSKAGFITGLSVVLVPIFSFFLLKLRPSVNAWIGVCLATTGLYLLTMTDTAQWNIGDVFVFVCAIGFALHIIFTGKFSHRYPSLLLTIVQTSTVAFLSAIFAFFFENWQQAFQPKILFSRNVLLAIVITSVLATALAFFIQTNVQKFTTPTRVALIFAMEPVFAAVTAYFWAHERLSISALIGCLLILFGMVLAELPARKKVLTLKRKQEL